MQKIKSNLFEIVSNLIRKRLLIIFTKSHAMGEGWGLKVADNQMDTKEALPAWIMPLFLLCKDNIVFGEMQIAIFRSDAGAGGSCAKIFDKVGRGKQTEMGAILPWVSLQICR